MMDKHRSLDKIINKNKVINFVIEGGRAIPKILGCTGMSYSLEFMGCSVMEKMLKGEPNAGFHLATGSGLYGGFTESSNRKAVSLIVFGISYSPEISMLFQGEDLEQIGISAGTKLLGYGAAYAIGYGTRTIRKIVNKSGLSRWC